MMTWDNCISANRTGKVKSKDAALRSDYQRDYDRLIFSSAFRRLQNKTQVFPLPGSSTFVHNRLTHSLEVASVGRSLGSLVGQAISSKVSNPLSTIFYTQDLPGVVGAACLAHDVGNPAFGHSGEKAISNYFITNQDAVIAGAGLSSFFNKKEWSDLTNFEGNANALRVLTHQFHGKAPGGLGLTYTTLASILKYPCESSAVTKAKHRKKYGYFQAEQDLFVDLVQEVHMKLDEKDPVAYFRHPFVYLVEAADDICYRIIDMEDAHRINILSTEEVEHAFIAVIQEIQRPDYDQKRLNATIQMLTDPNERIAYLRAKTINSLVMECVDIFKQNMEDILQANYKSTLMDDVETGSQSLKIIDEISRNRIYDHASVIKVEIAGYKVMSGLLEIFVPAILEDKKSSIHKKSLKLLPMQFDVTATASPYEKVMTIIDFISGMTDDYAMELYRNIMGIEIAAHGV